MVGILILRVLYCCCLRYRAVMCVQFDCNWDALPEALDRWVCARGVCGAVQAAYGEEDHGWRVCKAAGAA